MPRSTTRKLSPQEDAILRLSAEGFTDAAIGNRLGISEATVGTYWGRVRTKMGAHSRGELIAIYVRAQTIAEVGAGGPAQGLSVEALQQLGFERAGELDLDGNGILEAQELGAALQAQQEEPAG